jgi:hypothetical protein
MSTGGIFQLITNDGKQDRMILATALLQSRLKAIEEDRKNRNLADPSPTLVDIERTHLLFVNAHFKPFCATCYEYNQTPIQGGTIRLGQTDTQFSIPQFGDFFNDMVIRVKLGAVEADNVEYWSEPTLNPANGSELLQYADNLGLRLFKRVRFSVNGNPLDEYNSDISTFHGKYFVTPNKVTGWNRMNGQETIKKGFQDVRNQTGLTNPVVNGYGRGSGVREVKYFVDGPQTPKPAHGEIELFIPLLFWFNKDPRLSIPSVSIPYGQRFIYVDIANTNEILQHKHAYDPNLDNPVAHPAPSPDIRNMEIITNNLFVNPEIHDIFIKRVGFSLIRVHRFQSLNINANNGSFQCNLLRWPIETIYTGFQPPVNRSTSSNKMLTSWYKYSILTDVEVQECALQNGYSWTGALPVGSGITAVQYSAAFASFTGLALDFASVLGVVGATVLTVAQLNLALTTQGYPPLSGTFANLATPTGLEIIAATPGSACVATFQQETPVIERLGWKAHGVQLYAQFPILFYNSYVSYTFGGQTINTPEDVGVQMTTFNLYPGHYQPSGHINISRAREFYIEYTSQFIGTTDLPNCDLIIIGIAINFLLISDGSAVLRYST